MSSEIGLLGALLGGVLLLLSPCSALLLPSFFAYAFDGVGKLAARSALFYLGLATVMVPLGAGVGAFSSLVTRYRGTATLVGGIVLIVFGVVIIVGKGFSFGPAQRASASITISGNVSVYLLGTVYALAGFCAGPLIGAVLSLALIGSNPIYGGVIGAVFALGMTLPMFLLALLWDRFNLGSRRWLRGRGITIGPLHTHTTSLVSGLLFIAIGALFLATDGTANLGGIVGVDTDQQLQENVSRIAGSVSNTAVIFSGVLVAALVLGWRILRRRRSERRDAGSDVDDHGEHVDHADGGHDPQRR
ncbi:cytochrome c biogenesis CcdA family protein [Tomitella gaofuii]|uniref:cytochrome c biogenesis CcdA family protein n=1 Tax=Tomitella gaofuii TaxID=2760083 RepID=UPI0015FCE402|nr:cytochrome c biogenesis CcdA family protein [Tomitella gaofuii]